MTTSKFRANVAALVAFCAMFCPVFLLNAGQAQATQTEAEFMHLATDFVDGTTVLAILAEKFSRDKVIRPGWVNKNWYPRLQEAGYADADIVDGSEISALSYCYGHNSKSGCSHQGLYFAHVPPPLRDQLQVGNVGNVSDRNDIVEIELRMLPSKLLIGVVKRIYRHANDWGSCRAKFLSSSKMYALSPVGPPIGLWIVCDGLEDDGWNGLSVRGAPLPSGTDEGESANIHEWRRIPPIPAPENSAR